MSEIGRGDAIHVGESLNEILATRCFLVVAIRETLDLMITREIHIVEDPNDHFDPRKWTRIDNVVEVLLIEVFLISIQVFFGRFHRCTADVTLMTVCF